MKLARHVTSRMTHAVLLRLERALCGLVASDMICVGDVGDGRRLECRRCTSSIESGLKAYRVVYYEGLRDGSPIDGDCIDLEAYTMSHARELALAEVDLETDIFSIEYLKECDACGSLTPAHRSCENCYSP